MENQLQRKRSFNNLTVSHNFRKEYKGSVLEKKFHQSSSSARKTTASSSSSSEKPFTTIRSLAGWIYTKATKKVAKTSQQIVEVSEEEEADIPVFDKVPNEILFEILKNCKDQKSAVLACRRVSSRFNACMDVVDNYAPCRENTVLSRLVISGLGKKGIEMRWVSYVGQKTNAVVVSWPAIKKITDFSFNFRKFEIQRILLKNVPLCDELVDFIRHQLQFADVSKLIQLSLNNIDFSPANCLTLHRLIAPISKSVEIFEITQGFGMRVDSVTDEHLAQLDASSIRRISIDGVKFGGASTTYRHLKIGDGALKRFARLGVFPTMILDRCAVSTQVVCDYTKKWFEQCNESEKQLRSQVCTVKRCPKVKGSQFEAECQRRGLRCKNRRGSGSLTLYNVQEENTKREFTIALAALEEKAGNLKLEEEKPIFI